MNERYGWRVRIHKNPASDSVGIYIMKDIGRETHLMQFDKKTGGWKMNLLEEYAVLEKPTLSFSGYDVMSGILEAFANALADENIQTVNQHKLEGILEAKNEHLDDMRKLVFSAGFQANDNERRKSAKEKK